MKFENWPAEWQEWVRLTPIERFREREKIFAQYLAMGGCLDPDLPRLRKVLDAEVRAEQEKDRIYWEPLKREMEGFRRAERA